MKQGILKMSLVLGGLFAMTQVVHAGECDQYYYSGNGEALMQCCSNEGAYAAVDPDCGQFSQYFGGGPSMVTCWDNSQAPSQSQCPPQPVLCPDNQTYADQLADCPADILCPDGVTYEQSLAQCPAQSAASAGAMEVGLEPRQSFQCRYLDGSGAYGCVGSLAGCRTRGGTVNDPPVAECTEGPAW